ncbi:hypothetical protein DL769_008500 [Monosporascus sp. CRB-8-3]|nr:hypothetical protein DL769_008500 [Monosporascus sp. CRB-8-3]
MDTTTRHEQDKGEKQPSSPPPLLPKSSSSHRALVKGPLKSPAAKRPEHLKSYTLPPKTNGEVTIRKAADRKRRPEPVKISSTAVPQPFVDPAVLERGRHA